MGLAKYSVFSYTFNSESEELWELVERRGRHQEFSLYKIHKIDGEFFYVGKKGIIMKLTIEI